MTAYTIISLWVCLAGFACIQYSFSRRLKAQSDRLAELEAKLSQPSVKPMAGPGVMVR